MRNKSILLIFSVIISICFIFMFFVEKEMLDKYKNSKYLNQSMELTCEKVIDQYETNSMSFSNNEEKFEYWQFCISEKNQSSISAMLYVFSLLAIVFLSISFYLAKSNLVISNKALLLILLSPLAILVLIGFINTAYQLILSEKDPSAFKNAEALSFYLVLIPVFIFVWLIRKLMKFKRRRFKKL